MAAREGTFLRDFLRDLGYGPEGPTILYLDSKSAIDLAFDAVAFKKTKHVLRDAYFLRDLVVRLVYKPVHVCSADHGGHPDQGPSPHHLLPACGRNHGCGECGQPPPEARVQEGLTRLKAGYGSPDAFGAIAGTMTSHI